MDIKQRRRIYYSVAQRPDIWGRWQAGEAMSSIGRRCDQESSSVSGSFRQQAVSDRLIDILLNKHSASLTESEIFR